VKNRDVPGLYIDHGGAHFIMPQQLLESTNVVSVLKEMCGKGMPGEKNRELKAYHERILLSSGVEGQSFDRYVVLLSFDLDSQCCVGHGKVPQRESEGDHGIQLR